ncbi:hypothetical protein [Streptomyces sp. NPDC058758]|uniref:hypothetical protein n=1 Tax=Streptomyces sp. NPDC058758 TaxID=3346627 RepID=UPI00367A7F63
MKKPIDKVKRQEIRLRRTRKVTPEEREGALTRLAERAKKGQFDHLLDEHRQHASKRNQ